MFQTSLEPQHSTPTVIQIIDRLVRYAVDKIHIGKSLAIFLSGGVRHPTCENKKNRVTQRDRERALSARRNSWYIWTVWNGWNEV